MSDNKQEEISPFLLSAFNKARENLPGITSNAIPVGIGSFGLVIAHEDGSLSKIFYRHLDEQRQKTAVQSFTDEITAMRILTDFPLDDITTPALIGTPEQFEDGDYFGRYSMTRVPGTTMRWWDKDEESIACLGSRHEAAGRLLARFHDAVLRVPFEMFRGGHIDEAGHVPQVSILPVRVNDAIAKVARFLDENREPGVAHNDFHGGNIMVDDHDNITGLLDFAFTCQTRNRLTDFRSAMGGYEEHMIRGYEQESGRTISRHVITAEALGRQTGMLHYLQSLKTDPESHPELPAQETAIITEINKYLNDLIPISGYKP